MAELEVVAQYKSWPARAVLGVVVLLMPLWGVLSPILFCICTWILVMDWRNIFSDPSRGIQVVGVLLGLAIIAITGVFLTLSFADDRIIASKAGLRIPFFLSFGSLLRRSFAWSDIKALKLSGDENQKIGKLCMTVTTRQDRRINLHLGKLKECELEQLLIAAELWCKDAVKDSNLEVLHHRWR